MPNHDPSAGDASVDTATEVSGRGLGGVPDSLSDRWRLSRRLGAGGQGEVWLAWDRELEESVAIKVLARPDRPTSAARLKREVAIGRRLRHPHLVQIFELEEHGSSIAVVMEYLDGGTLADRLEIGSATSEEIVTLADAMLDALAHLHNHGLVHRDVKPSNILFDARGTPKLADLGTVRMITGDSDLTGTAMAVGTPAFMSPEQQRGEEALPASDLYSLGLTLHRMLNSTAGASSSTTTPAPSWLTATIRRLTAADPRDRWPDAHAALRALRRRRPGLPRRFQRRLGLALGVGALLAAGAALTILDREPIADDVRTDDGRVTALDAGGRAIWNWSHPHLVAPTAAADLTPDAPGAEIVALTIDRNRIHHPITAHVLGPRGQELASGPLLKSPPMNLFRTMSPRFSAHRVRAFRLATEFPDQMYWIVNHSEWYPGVLGRGVPGIADGPRTVFVNSGHIHAIHPFDADGDGHSHLAVLGVNNPLGFQAFLAVVDPRRAGVGRSPDLLVSDDSGWSANALVSYVLLGETSETGFALETDSTGRFLSASMDGATVVMGPESLVDPTAVNSKAFWQDVAAVGQRSVMDPGAAVEGLLTLEKRHPRLWGELSCRAGAAIMVADRLAEGGSPDAGADLIARVIDAGSTIRRLHRHRGELLLLAGRTDPGIAALERSIALIGQGFNPSDELLALALLAALEVDPALDERVTRQFAAFPNLARWQRESNVIRDFYAGRFTRARRDLEPRLGAVDMAFVFSLWAGMETGEPFDESNEIRAFVNDRVEASPFLELMEIRRLIRAGDGASAASRAEALRWGFARRARTSWLDAVALPLADWIYAATLEASGDLEGAREAHRRVVTAAPKTFFGRDARERLGD
jgi:hypothetical protein